MSKYEIAVVVSARLEDEERAAVIDRVKDLVTRFGGTVTDVDDWGKKTLAYEIQKIFNKDFVYTNYLPEDIEYVEYTPEGQVVTFAQLLNTLVNNTLNNNNGSILDQLTGNSWYCPKCGRQNNGNFCEVCGTARPINNSPSFCSNCGYKFKAGENPRFCPQCGKQLY